MRTLNKNTTRMWYALHRDSEPIYKLDEYGHKIVVYVDDSTDPPTEYYEKEGSTEEGYSEPVEFYGNIAFNKSGEAETTEFGVSLADYEADVTVSKNLLPIDETSLIWTHEPLMDGSGYAIGSDADFTVLKVLPSLNETKYLLAKVQK